MRKWLLGLVALVLLLQPAASEAASSVTPDGDTYEWVESTARSNYWR